LPQVRSDQDEMAKDMRASDSSLHDKFEEIYELVDEDKAVEFLQDICRIPSVTGEEEEIAEFLESYMKSKGLDARQERVQGDRANVVAKIKGRGKGVNLMITGHMDTVPVANGWKSDPYSGDLRGGWVFGQGVTDMKGGLAAMIVATDAINRSGLSLEGDLIAASVMGHMEHGMGTEALLKTHPETDMAIIAEPTDFEVCIAQRGWIYFDVHTSGKVAHTSVKSPNAVVQMAEIAVKLNRLEFKMPVIPDRIKDLFPGPAAYLNVGPIKGGLFPNQVPDQCEMTVDVRPTYNKKPLEVLEEIRDAIEEVRKSDHELNAKVSFHPGYPRSDFVIDASQPPVRLVEKAYGEVFRKKPKLVGKPWWSDAAVLYGKGKIPTLICGPGGSPYYLVDERLRVKDYLAAVRLYITSAVLACGLPKSQFHNEYGRFKNRG
jgi:acetylornithine deacetylase